MKKSLHLGSFFSIILTLVYFADIFFTKEIKSLEKLIGFSFKSEIIFISTILFFIFLKNFANFKHYIHSEEFKFMLLFLLLFINYSLHYIILNISNHKNIWLLILIGLNLLKLAIEFNIYNILRKKIKKRLFIISMLTFQTAVFLMILKIILFQLYKILIFFNANINFSTYFINNLEKLTLVSNCFYFMAYLSITFIFLKPKEKFSF